MEIDHLNKIRHFKGSVKDFKDYFDKRAGKNTNAFGTPNYQGFNNIHPTRGSNKSPHWDNTDEVNTDKSPSELTENIDYSDKMSYSQLEKCIDYASLIRKRIEQGESLDPWMHSKIAVVENKLNSIWNAIDGGDGIIESKEIAYNNIPTFKKFN